MVWSQKFRKSEISLDTGYKNFGTRADSETENVTAATSAFQKRPQFKTA